jgi:hypothetical protein
MVRFLLNENKNYYDIETIRVVLQVNMQKYKEN